jgi:hypothetical protein
VEFRGNRADAESQNEKIEGIERPSEKTGDERVALRCSEASKMSPKLDGLLPGTGSTRVSVALASLRA